MRLRSWSTLVFALLALGQPSCATMGLAPLPESMSAARAALPPECRLFYDALQDYGDWTLIEPFGYVFRPFGHAVGWRPYQDGYWVASDVYGWVWISAEPFGWATYHYGEWLYDRYQGWVWVPGLEWGPAWVSWQQAPDYIGWAPLFPSGYAPDLVPGSEYLYAPTAELAATDLKARVHTKDQLGDRLGTPQPIENLVQRGGITFNAGPEFPLIEQRAGPLRRVKIEDLLPAASPGARPGVRITRTPAPVPGRQPAVQGPGARPAPAGAPEPPGAAEAVKRAAEETARQARSVTEQKTAPPSSIGIVRPAVKREAGRRETPREPVRERAEADSTKK